MGLICLKTNCELVHEVSLLGGHLPKGEGFFTEWLHGNLVISCKTEVSSVDQLQRCSCTATQCLRKNKTENERKSDGCEKGGKGIKRRKNKAFWQKCEWVYLCTQKQHLHGYCQIKHCPAWGSRTEQQCVLDHDYVPIRVGSPCNLNALEGAVTDFLQGYLQYWTTGQSWPFCWEYRGPGTCLGTLLSSLRLEWSKSPSGF